MKLNDFKIIVGTNEGRDNFVDHFASMTPLWAEPLVDIAYGTYELAQIQKAYHSNIGRFLYLQDTMWVSDWVSLIDKIESAPETAYCFPRPSMYSAIYSSRVLGKMDFPKVNHKEDAIFWETVWVDQYELRAAQLGLEMPTLYPEANDHEAIAAQRYYVIPDTDEISRLHLRSKCGTINKAKATYR